MNRLGILHLTTFLQGGAGRAIAQLASAQHSAGHRVIVVTSATGESGYDNYPEYLEGLGDAGVALHRWDSLFKRNEALNSHVLDMLQQRVGPGAVDIVHAHAAMPAAIGRRFAAGAATRIPVVQTQHGWGTSKSAAQAADDVAVLRQVDRVVATSHATGVQLASFGVPATTIEVIPCGIERECAALSLADAERLISPIRARGAVVGCVGSVTDNKNQRLLVDALARLGDVDVEAVFVGEGGEALAAYAAMSGVGNRVHAVGYQSKAWRWLPSFDLLVLPSRSEGQGLAVLEAFRAGLPVVASDIPALAELIDRSNGFLFRSDDAADLADTLRVALRMTSAERNALVARGRRTLEADYTVERMIARHDELYARLARPS